MSILYCDASRLSLQSQIHNNQQMCYANICIYVPGAEEIYVVIGDFMKLYIPPSIVLPIQQVRVNFLPRGLQEDYGS